MYARTTINKVLKEKILGNTRWHTKFYDVSQPYNILKKLEVKVNPELEVVDFYGGYRIPEHGYVPQTREAVEELEKQREGKTRETLELESILNNFDQGHITFVGEAGSGKSTLLRRIARDVIDGKYQNLSDIEVVHYLEGRDLNFTKELTPAQLLFNNVDPEMSEAELRETMDFARFNPSKVLFVIDSLDTLQHNIDGVYTSIDIEDKAYPQVILWNLLTGKLLPGCRCITSSREHAIRNYKGDLRPNKVVALTGLSNESIEKVITGYLGEEECKKTMEYLETKAPAVRSICSTPVFLVFTLIGLQAKSKFKPSTMTGIMILLLQSLIRSEHSHAEDIMEVINKLKHLAYMGTTDGRVIFSTDQLEEFGLNPVEVTDLAVVAPGGGRTFLMESQNGILYFTHQSLQEVLAAMHLAEMDIEDFKSFMDGNFRNPHYYVVRRFLFGLLFDLNVIQETGMLIKASSCDGKQVFLKQLVENRLKDEDDADQLELFMSLNEAANGLQGIISSCVDSIVFNQKPLSASDVQVIGSVAQQCKKLDRLKLQNCNLDSRSPVILHSCLEGSDVQVGELDMAWNKNMGVAGLSEVGKIMKECHIHRLTLHDCDLKPEELKAFGESAQGSKINKLNLAWNKNMRSTGISEVERMMKTCSIRRISLQNCNLTPKMLEKLEASAREAKVEIQHKYSHEKPEQYYNECAAPRKEKTNPFRLRSKSDITEQMHSSAAGASFQGSKDIIVQYTNCTINVQK